MIFVIFVPFSSALVTETQFSNGTSSYLHTFSGQGDGLAGEISIPNGAIVSDAGFTLTGTSSSQSYTNMTTDANFGGEGTNSWQSPYPPNVGYAYRTSLEAKDDSLQLRDTKTNSQRTFSKLGDLSSAGSSHQNTSGQFVANGDQGYNALTLRKSDISLDSTSTWNYPGPVISQEDDYHVIHWSSSSVSSVPTVKRFNQSTGDLEGNVNWNYGTCTSQVTNYIYDATSGGEGVLWTVSYNYGYLAKWELNTQKTQWVCQDYWMISTSFDIAGVDIDEQTGKMYLYAYENLYPNYNRYLYEVNPTSVGLNINGSWLLGSSSDFSGTATGLVVDLPRVIAGTRSGSTSYHYHYRFEGLLLERQAVQPFSNLPHYGMDIVEDGTIGFTCYSGGSCSSLARKIIQYGDGSISDLRTPTSSASVVISPNQVTSIQFNALKFTGMLGYQSSQSSIEIALSNDGGATWISAEVGDTVSFSAYGTQFQWKAWLNGTNTETPVLDFVSIEYTSSYYSSGYFYCRFGTYNANSMPVAATINYNATVPSGSNLKVEIRQGSTSSTSSNILSFSSGQTRSITLSSGYLYLYVTFTRGTSPPSTPVLYDLNLTFVQDAPTDVKIDIGDDNVFEWEYTDTLLGTTVASGQELIDGLNEQIEGTGQGMNNISVVLTSETAGILSLDEFFVTYSMNTLNLDIIFNKSEILHQRNANYEVVTRHIIGDNANSIRKASLQIKATPLSSSPTLEWDAVQGFLTPNDPSAWIDTTNTHSYVVENNGMLEIHWQFDVTTNFPEQTNVKFVSSCTDDSDANGGEGYSPALLTSADSLSVNHTFGLGWMQLVDESGSVVRDDVQSGEWVAAGETLTFTGAMWYLNTEDTPRDSAFDVRISQDGYLCSTCRDTSNMNGMFHINVDMPQSDIPEGVTFELQTYNERDPNWVLFPNEDWQRFVYVDGTPPQALSVSPLEDAYEAASVTQPVSINIMDEVGNPHSLTLNYWVEADHDLNLNGEPDDEEYVNKSVYNSTDASSKTFTTYIDHSRNPNMGRVSYYWSGGDRAGNELYHLATIDGETFSYEKGPGYLRDDATFRTRKDSTAEFTGLDWNNHVDGQAVYAGQTQQITLGLIDANTAIDFEYVSLVFDFEGPNPLTDRQVISYSGFTNTFTSESDYIHLQSNTRMVESISSTGLPLILLNFEFIFDWSWPDEDISDLVLMYKERGSEYPTQHIIVNHTFFVENDIVLSPSDFEVLDISEPRLGPVADGSRIRNDDRLEFSGRVVYENSNVPISKDESIVVEVFDGQHIWSDGSLSEDGDYSIEVPLSSASALINSPTRTCLISIKDIPGTGQDMTGQSISTTLRLVVDSTAPRVLTRTAPVNLIDISSISDLSQVAVSFNGTEDADLTGSEQVVHWVMKDSSRTVTIGAGESILGRQQSGQDVSWTGTVDLTNGGTLSFREGDWVGFYLTGWDAAGNEFPEISNSEASPIPEFASVDTDFERQWVRLGATGPELTVIGLNLDDDHVSPGQKVKIEALVSNSGGSTSAQFRVAFYEGEATEPFDVSTLNSIQSGEILTVSTTWSARENIDRIRVVVDPDDLIIEVNNENNGAEHAVSVVYGSYLGWLDSPREQPLVWLFVIISLVTLVAIGVTASRTAVTFDEDHLMDDDWEEDDEYDEFDEYDED